MGRTFPKVLPKPHAKGFNRGEGQRVQSNGRDVSRWCGALLHRNRGDYPTTATRSPAPSQGADKGAASLSVEIAQTPPDTKGVILSGAPAESNCEAVPSEAMVESWAAAFLSLRLRLLAFGEILRLASIGSLRMTQKMLGALRAFPKIFIHHPGYTLSFLCKGICPRCASASLPAGDAEGVWGEPFLKRFPHKLPLYKKAAL